MYIQIPFDSISGQFTFTYGTCPSDGWTRHNYSPFFHIFKELT